MFTSKKMNKGDTNSLENICKKYEGGKYENTSKSKLRILDIFRNKIHVPYPLIFQSHQIRHDEVIEHRF